MGTRKSNKKKKKKKRKEWALYSLARSLGPVCYVSSNSYFHILNNITHISTHFFIYTYFKKLKKTIKITFQTTLPNTSLSV